MTTTTNRFLRHPLARPAAVLIVLGLVLVLAQLTLPGQATTRGGGPDTGRAAIGRMTLVCPGPADGRMSVAAAPGDKSAGRATIRTVGGTNSESHGRQLGSVPRRGVVWTEELGEDAPATVVRARQSMAAGLEAEQVSSSGPGLSGTRCPRPDTDFWFVGDGVELGRATTLYLVNVDDVRVSLDVDVYGRRGPVVSVSGSGITVEPHSRKKIKLGALAPKARIAALHVETNSGRIAAALRTRVTRGEHSGSDWIPPTVSPRTELVVPGLPGGGGTRRLLLAAPGDRPARVQMEVVTTEGTYPVKRKKAVRVPPGSVRSVNLTPALNRHAGAVRITSDVPVTATVGASIGGEIAYTSATPSIGESGAVVADNGPDPGMTSRLLLSAPIKPAAVRVSTFGPDGPTSQGDIVRIPTGRTVAVTVTPPPASEGNFALTVTPVGRSGPVYGARMLRRDAASSAPLTLLPLKTSRTWVKVPDAERDLGTITE